MRTGRTGNDAPQILKAMSDYVASQKNIALTYDSDIEVVTPEVKNLNSPLRKNPTEPSRQGTRQPDRRLRRFRDFVRRQDGDGLGKNINAYAQIDFADSIDQLDRKNGKRVLMTAPVPTSWERTSMTT